MKKVVFLDYHGVLTKVNKISVKSPPRIDLILSNSIRALKLLSKHFFLFIISNQAGVAFGDYSEDELKKSIRTMIKEFHLAEISVIDFFYCPHHPKALFEKYETPCECRKPSPFYVKKVFNMTGISTKSAVFVGDNMETDIACAASVGIPTILITEAYLQIKHFYDYPNFYSCSLLDSVPIISRLLS